MIKYPKYYRLLGRCIKRTTDTVGLEVLTPDNIADTFPLAMSPVTHPDKAHFDETIAKMEEVDKDCWEAYILNFLGSVEVKINKPMNDRLIQKALNAMTQNRSNSHVR